VSIDLPLLGEKQQSSKYFEEMPKQWGIENLGLKPSKSTKTCSFFTLRNKFQGFTCTPHDA
jgi:hypothetical protein